jgi:type IV pilus assembly protein PilE
VYNSVNCSIAFPVISEKGYYSIAKTVDTANTYTLTATRAGTQATDRCGDFTYTHTGVKNIINASGGLTLDDCWK